MPALDAMHLRSIWADDLVSHRGMADFAENYVESFRTDPAANAAMAAFEREHGAGSAPVDRGGWLGDYESGGRLRGDLRRWLDSALTFYVDPKMHALVTAAAESMPEETLLPRDLPGDYGFMVIPGGLGIVDVRGQLLKYNAVQWATFGGHVYLMWLTDKNDPEDSVNLQQFGPTGDGRRHYEVSPRLVPGGHARLAFGDPLPMTFGPDIAIGPGQKIATFRNDNPDGSTSYAWAIAEGYEPGELAERMTISARPDPATRWLVACWRLMQQTVVDVREEHAPRQARRALERKNHPTAVTVIELRRRAARGPGETEVEWTHRWLRRGHWRRQWYGTGEDREQRLVWIHPTICGPDDLPLLLRDHVYSLTR